MNSGIKFKIDEEIGRDCRYRTKVVWSNFDFLHYRHRVLWG